MKNFLAMSLIALAAGAHAADQSTPPAMLVLDGSGSMWGQIEGVAKIAIAREVLNDLLDQLPAGQALGLTAYGHREEGNCSDIETLVAPGPDANAAIRNAVKSIQPKGKTPLSDALLISADTLNARNNPATVILVTDGLENCGQDPCAMARRLEAAGVDFTTHVIGFGIAEGERAKLECIAEETGGLFLTAQTASELADALTSVTQIEPLPAYQPQPLRGQFEAYDENGLIFRSLEWTLYGPDGEVVVGEHISNQLVADLVPDQAYRVTAKKLDTGELAELAFKPTGEGLTFSRKLRFSQ